MKIRAPRWPLRAGRISIVAHALGGFFIFLLLTSCGYHVPGTANALPKNIHTIAVTAFGNVSTQYKLADLLTASVTRELIERTRYKVTADANEADAILSGGLVNFFSYPTTVDPATQRSTGAQVIIIMQVSLRDKAGNILFNRPNMEVRERYEISENPKTYFDESAVAMHRISNDAARSIVSAILEKF